MPSNAALKIDVEAEDFALMFEDYKNQVAAIDKSQAVIEFSLDGRITHANANFLDTLGYSLQEIQGQHHSMFLDPADRSSTEYQMFWAKLGRGEFDAGQYRRIAKGGREVWIQASYNPVFDADGRPAKVIKFATDITEQKVASADSRGQLDAISKAQAVISFDLEGRVLDANPNFLSVLGYGIDEIRGQHHSLFVEPEYRQSAEYQGFWTKLGRGEYDAGQYKRIGKGGREVWIQASYNPILDLNGRPFKVVKYATDITAQRDQRKLAERVHAISNIVASAATEMQATAESMARSAEDATRQAGAVSSAAQVASANVQTVAAAGEELSSAINEIARQVAESTNITARRWSRRTAPARRSSRWPKRPRRSAMSSP